MGTGPHTNNWADDHLNGTVDTGAKIDDEMNKLSKDVRERAIRGGLWIKDGSNDGRQGVLYVSPSAYDINEWNVYGADGSGEPDVNDKRLTVTETDMTVGNTSAPGDLAVTGDLTVTGDLVVTGTSGTIDGDAILTEGTTKKRTIILSGSAMGDGSSAYPRIKDVWMSFGYPSVSGHYTSATLISWRVMLSSSSSPTFSLYKGGVGFTSSDPSYINTDPGTSKTLLVTRTPSSAVYGLKDDVSFALTGGELFEVTVPGYVGTVHVELEIELDY